MTNCVSCFTEVTDKKRTTCQTCKGVLHTDCAIRDNGTFCDTCYTEELSKPEIFEFEMPKIIRRSYIKQYEDCPYQFYQQHALGLEQEMNIYAQMGIDLHDLFERGSLDKKYFNKNMRSDFKEMFNSYDGELFEGLYGSTTSKDMLEKGIESIDKFYDIISDMEGTLHSAEKTFRFGVGEDLPLVQATIDRVNLVDGKLEVVDWKTGRVTTGKALSSDLQPPLYIKAVQEKYPDLTVERFILHFLSESKERVYERVNDDNYVCTVGKREYKINITDTVRRVQHVFSQIKKNNFNIPIDTKGMFFTCKMCHVKKAGKCQGAEAQVWNQFN